MAKKKVFISFDWENDRNYKYLLTAWDSNSQFEFSIADYSSGEIKSEDVGRVKAALTTKINAATHTLVIIGAEANAWHKDSDKIGFRNWINFEIARAKSAGHKLIAVKLDRSYTSPDEILNSDASWAYSFTEEAIMRALRLA